MKTTHTPNRLRTYGSLALGSTALLATHADAATIVDVNATSFNTTFSGIGTVDHLTTTSFNYLYSYVRTGSNILLPIGTTFRRASDTATVGSSTYSTSQIQYGKTYLGVSDPYQGALLNSSDNWFYATAASNTNQRVWLQFQFGNGDGSGFSIIKAVYPSSPGELPSAFAASTAVPEPSALALLTLGASGLLVRRRRNTA